MTRLLILGATGDVGRGVVRSASARGWSVVASSRRADQCSALDLPGVSLVPADAGDPEDLARLGEVAGFDAVDAVVVAVSPATSREQDGGDDTATFVSYVADSLRPHHAALRAFVPVLQPETLFLGIGGGMADLVLRGYGHVSAAQAAQRMLYRLAAKETAGTGISVRELLVRSMVAGDSNRHQAPSGWITDAEVGEAVCGLVEHGPADDAVLELHPPVRD